MLNINIKSTPVFINNYYNKNKSNKTTVACWQDVSVNDSNTVIKSSQPVAIGVAIAELTFSPDTLAITTTATSSLTSARYTSVVIVNESVTVDIASGEGVNVTIGTGAAIENCLIVFVLRPLRVTREGGNTQCLLVVELHSDLGLSRSRLSDFYIFAPIFGLI